ncbi:MAG: enoyl-CoA hydratase-related protein, partial [Solirubrobacteraceae bacterium]|nr:enoyl-CoA hydratase-related protein [Solirubrobacteraceae bacterium]
MAEFVRLEVSDGVGTIRLDRPKMNALDVAMQEEIRAAATEASERDDVKAVVVYGGERVFAAGADVKEMAEMSHVDMVKRSGGLQSALTAVARIPKPVVAAVTGYALGGGCELALCADIRIAADDAVLGQPEILLGIIPGAGGTQRLSRLVGPSRAKDIIFTGRFVKADEALAIGLVDRVVPAASVYEEALAWAGRFAGAASYALRAAKESIDRGLEVDLETGLEIERVQ